MDLTFFGLSTQILTKSRTSLFKQIHEIVFHGKGGYDYFTVYNMPIWLRNYTYSQIKEFYEKETKAINSSSQDQNSTSANVGDPMPEHMKKMFQDQSKKSSYTTQKAKK